jgi:putative hydrolase of the HAD superfamily
MTIDLNGIRNIIFDLGKVLLNLDFDASIKAFFELGLDRDVLSPQQAYADPVFYNLEVGKVTPEEFRIRARQILKNPTLSDKQIDDAWSAMILNIPKERVKLLQELGKKYKLFLFSNTNKIHIDRLHNEFRTEHEIEFPSLFQKVFYSFEIHERKPDVSSYQKVIELSGVNPSESLFIDDLKKNVIGAQKAGLKTYWLNEGKDLSELF